MKVVLLAAVLYASQMTCLAQPASEGCKGSPQLLQGEVATLCPGQAFTLDIDIDPARDRVVSAMILFGHIPNQEGSKLPESERLIYPNFTAENVRVVQQPSSRRVHIMATVPTAVVNGDYSITGFAAKTESSVGNLQATLASPEVYKEQGKVHVLIVRGVEAKPSVPAPIPAKIEAIGVR